MIGCWPSLPNVSGSVLKLTAPVDSLLHDLLWVREGGMGVRGRQVCTWLDGWEEEEGGARERVCV